MVKFTKTKVYIDSSLITIFEEGYIKKGVEIIFYKPLDISEIKSFVDNKSHKIRLNEIKGNNAEHIACFNALVRLPEDKPSSETIIFEVESWKDVLINPPQKRLAEWMHEL